MFKITATISMFLCAQQFAFAGPAGTVLGDAVPLQWTVMTDASGAKVDYPAGFYFGSGPASAWNRPSVAIGHPRGPFYNVRGGQRDTSEPGLVCEIQSDGSGNAN
jgi:hypothetical protein